MEGHGQLDGAEAGGDMAAGLLHRFHGECPDLGAQLEQLVLRERAQIGRSIDAREDAHQSSYYGRCWTFLRARRSSRGRPATSATRSYARSSSAAHMSRYRCATTRRTASCGPRSAVSPERPM